MATLSVPGPVACHIGGLVAMGGLIVVAVPAGDVAVAGGRDLSLSPGGGGGAGVRRRVVQGTKRSGRVLGGRGPELQRAASWSGRVAPPSYCQGAAIAGEQAASGSSALSGAAAAQRGRVPDGIGSRPPAFCTSDQLALKTRGVAEPMHGPGVVEALTPCRSLLLLAGACLIPRGAV